MRGEGTRPYGRHMFTSTAKKTITALVATAALFAPAAYAAESQDLRSPDARDAARAATEPQDLRSPDTRDAARSSAISPPATPSSPRPERAEPSATSFAWGDAGIGAATTFALLMLGSGTVLLIERQRRRQRPASTT